MYETWTNWGAAVQTNGHLKKIISARRKSAEFKMEYWQGMLLLWKKNVFALHTSIYVSANIINVVIQYVLFKFIYVTDHCVSRWFHVIIEKN